MTIGLVLLAIVAILIFFGVSERFFRSLGVSNWLAFLLVLALIVGAVIPAFTVGAVMFNLGGFVVPLVIMVVLLVAMRESGERFRAVLGSLSVAAVAVGARMLIEPTSSGLVLASSLIVGFAGGIAAFLVGQTRLPMLASVCGGIILGDIIVNFLYVFVIGGYGFSLGSFGVFDSVIIAACFGALVHGAIFAIKKAAAHRGETSAGLGVKSEAESGGKSGIKSGVESAAKKGGEPVLGSRFVRPSVGRGAALGMAESAQDEHFDEIRLHTGDAALDEELNPSPETRELSPADPLSPEGFFDDYV